MSNLSWMIDEQDVQDSLHLIMSQPVVLKAPETGEKCTCFDCLLVDDNHFNLMALEALL